MNAQAVYANQPAAAARLEALLPHIPQKSHEFVGSLLFWARNAGTHLSKGRAEWIAKMIVEAEGRAARSANGNEPRAKVEVADMSAVLALFDRAKGKLKQPKIAIAIDPAMGEMLRISVASERARFPGTLDVVIDGVPAEKRRDDEDYRHWLGRVKADGVLEVSPRFKNDPRVQAVAEKLQVFASDPVLGAKESARLTGRCVFCDGALKDERSTAVGYGKTCASRFDLPWK